MADRDVWRKNIPEDFDGRFGEKFDSEVGLRGVIEVTIGILVACAVGMAITWYMLVRNDTIVERTAPLASPIEQANEQRLPSGPLLQASPEAELEAMREEMSARLHGYGWVSEGGGVVHIPIEKAIDWMLAEQGDSAADEGSTEESANDAASGQAASGEPMLDPADEPDTDDDGGGST